MVRGQQLQRIAQSDHEQGLWIEGQNPTYGAGIVEIADRAFCDAAMLRPPIGEVGPFVASSDVLNRGVG
jgi:hypothetical protein